MRRRLAIQLGGKIIFWQGERTRAPQTPGGKAPSLFNAATPKLDVGRKEVVEKTCAHPVRNPLYNIRTGCRSIFLTSPSVMPQQLQCGAASGGIWR